MSLVWLYAIAGTDGTSWRGPKGLEAGAVRAVAEGDLSAIVSEVPDADYEQPALDGHVAEPAWLEPRATAHQSVNAAAHAALASTLPVPFGTIYRSEEGVRETLRSRSGELRAKLRSLEGRSEWVVGVYRDAVRAADHLARMRDAMTHREPVAAGEGRRYLEARKGAGERRAELGRLDDEAVAAERAAIARVSKTAFEEPVADTAGDLVARATYLLRRADAPRFDEAVARFNADWRDRGYELRATGPWPPYRSSREAA